MNKLHFNKIIQKIKQDDFVKSVTFKMPNKVTRNSEKLLKEALHSLNKLGLDLDELIAQITPLIEKVVQADRATIWILDRRKNDLFTRCLVGDSYQEIRVEISANSYLRKVIESGEPIQIPFDAYDSAYVNSKTRLYRVCSVLCVPIFSATNQLIGIVQVLNKIQPGDFPPYNPEQWPGAPKQWQMSFDEIDLKLMKILASKLGTILQNILLFQDCKKREMIEMDILQHFPHPFILTNRNGHIIVINQAAKVLLNLDNLEKFSKKSVSDVFNFKGRKFEPCFQSVLHAKTEPEKAKYYWNQLIILPHNPQKNINVNLWLMALNDQTNKQNIYGVLIILEEIKNSYN